MKKVLLTAFISFFLGMSCVTIMSTYNDASMESGVIKKKVEFYKNKNYFSPNNKKLVYTGRIDFSDSSQPRFDWPGSSVKIKFFGTSCSVVLDDGGNNYEIILDGKSIKTLVTESTKELYVLAENLESKEHLIELYKRTEASFGLGIFKGVVLSKEGYLIQAPILEKKIEFIGDSITCGYGNEGSSPTCDSLRPYENNYMAFGPITARHFNAQAHIISISGKGVVHNYGERVMKSPQPLPYFYKRILQHSTKKWNFKKWQPDIIVLGLGSNDYSTGFLPDDKTFINAYVNFLKTIRKFNPNSDIICLVTRQNKKKLVKNIKEAVELFSSEDAHVFTMGFSEFDQNELGCDYHPNVNMHKQMAKELIAFIEKNIWTKNKK